MKQLQVNRSDLSKTRIAEAEPAQLEAGQLRIEVEKFGFSANNITYGVAGDQLGYWQFFPALGGDEGWGVIPVWGFGVVAESQCADLPVGERLFGYFPPASEVVMTPGDVSKGHFFDEAAHRAALPKGYNIYRRVAAEPGYSPDHDILRMLLYPLYATSFTLWDQLKEENWYGADQVVIVSASSKTSIGLAYALKADEDAPKTVGLTSKRNLEFVRSLGLYDRVLSYDEMGDLTDQASAIVDMSGNADVLGALHAHLGDHMAHTLNVGLTHWDGTRKDGRINRDRSSFFFAPSRMQARMKELGAEEFSRRSIGFVMNTAAQSTDWLRLNDLGGLDGLEDRFNDVLLGKIEPQLGLYVDLEN